MAEISVIVIDPAMDHFPLPVFDTLRVRDLIPTLVTRLRLPEEVSYWLVPTATGEALAPERSLAGSGVGPGARLALVPVRDRFLAAFLRKLSQEAREMVREELWKEAQRQLDRIARLDPNYPELARLLATLPPPDFDLPFAEEIPVRPAPRRPEAAHTRVSGAKAVAAAKAPSAAGLAGKAAAVLLVATLGVAASAKPWERVDWSQLRAKVGASVGQTQSAGGPTGQPQQGPTGQAGGEKQEPFAVYVIDDPTVRFPEVMAGRLSVILDTPTGYLHGWGMDTKTKVREVTDDGRRFRMIAGPFATAAEARKAYEAAIEPGSERDISIMNTNVVRFKFDGKEHRINNATRFLR